MPAKSTTANVPVNSIGILPLQEAVLFPHTVIPLAVVKKPGIQLVEEALREGKPIGLLVLRDRENEEPGPDDVQRVGTIGIIQKMLKVPDGTLRCIVAGQQVFKIDRFTQVAPYMVAEYSELPDRTVENEELVAMQRNLAGLFQKLLSYLPQAPRDGERGTRHLPHGARHLLGHRHRPRYRRRRLRHETVLGRGPGSPRPGRAAARIQGSRSAPERPGRSGRLAAGG